MLLSYLSSLATLPLLFTLVASLPTFPKEEQGNKLEQRVPRPKTVYFDKSDPSVSTIPPNPTVAGSVPTTVYSITWIVSEGTYTPASTPTHIAKVVLHVNDKYPADPIKVNKNSKIYLTVKNHNVDAANMNNPPHYDEGISLHAHGLYQSKMPWMDGPVGITQQKIGVGRQFTYIWDIGEQTGTFWIHSHVSGQYPKGLRAPLIILDGTDADEENQYLGDRVLALTDWYNRPNSEVDDKYKNGNCGTGIPISPDDALINENKKAKTEIFVPPITSGNTKKTRIRLVNMSAYSSFYVYIRGRDDMSSVLQMEVIEVDGVKTLPQNFQVIQVHPGQRYSVLISPPTGLATAQGYAIMAALDPHEYKKSQINNANNANCAPGISFPDLESLKRSILFDYATLDFEFADGTNTKSLLPWQPKVDFTTVDPSKTITPSWVYYINPGSQWDEYRLCFPFLPNRICKYSENPAFKYDNFDELVLQPQVSMSAPPRPNPTSGVFPVTFQGINDLGGAKVGPFAASLHAGDPSGKTASDLAVSGNYDQDWGVSPATSTWPVNSNTFDVGDQDKWIWIVVKSMQGGHPIHLHGHHFQVLYASGEQTLSTNAVYSYNNVPVPVANPLRRDTIWLHKYELMVLAVKLDNPGVWFFHCHNDFHAMTGMAAQMVERPSDLLAKINSLGTAELNDWRILNGRPGYQFPWRTFP